MSGELVPFETCVDGPFYHPEVTCALAEDDDTLCLHNINGSAGSYQDERIKISRNYARGRRSFVHQGDRNQVHSTGDGRLNGRGKGVTVNVGRQEEQREGLARAFRSLCGAISSLGRGDGNELDMSVSERLVSLGTSVQDRLATLGANVPERLASLGARVPERLQSLGANVPERLSLLHGIARRQVVVWRESLAERMSGWRNTVVPREEMWVAVSDFCARRLDDVRVQWILLHSFLLERLSMMWQHVPSDRDSLMEAIVELWHLLRTGFALCWSFLTERLPTRDKVRSRLRIWRSIFRLQLLRERRKGGLWGSVSSFSRAQRDEFCQCCRDFADTEEDCRMAGDVKFILYEPEAKAVFVVLLLTFSLLLEVLAASYLGHHIAPESPCTETAFRFVTVPGFSRMTPFVYGV